MPWNRYVDRSSLVDTAAVSSVDQRELGSFEVNLVDLANFLLNFSKWTDRYGNRKQKM